MTKIKRISQEEPKIRVLYVEDVEVIRDTISRLLEIKGGFHVEYAQNGRDGVEKATKEQPDIVLMDLRMPVMDGHQAIRSLKANPETRHIPIFVVSAWNNRTDRNKALGAGADRYFVKPPDIDELIEAIKTAVTPV
jgi:CheY-like chemotaxis protein